MAERTILITGAAGGLGRPVAELFLAQRWRVVAPVRPAPVAGAAEVPAGAGQPAPRGAGRRPPAGVEVVEADLADPAAVAAAVEVAAADRAAPLRAVVNLAGGFAAGRRVHETPLADFEAILTRNLRPTYLVTAAALPHLVAAGGGSVVCVSSRAALQPFGGAAGYVTAKAAVLAFANAVAVDYAGTGVRCNTILPDIIDTPANRAAMPGVDPATWRTPHQIAQLIRFLASDESAATSGAAIPA